MRLKILIWATLTIVVGYSLFWYYVAGEVREKFYALVVQQEAKGLSIKHDDVTVSGFPYRIEFSLKNLTVTRAGKGNAPLLLTLPSITLVAFPWALGHSIILSTGAKIQIGSKKHPEFFMTLGKIRASLLVDLRERKFKNTSIIVESMTWAMGTALRSQKISKARDVRLHLLRPERSSVDNGMELPVTIKLYLEGRDVIAQDLLYEIFDRKADHVRLDIELHGVELPRYSKKSLSTWRDSGGTLVINNLDISSGKTDLELDGEITLDTDFKPLGTLSSTVYGIDHAVTIISQLSPFRTEQGRQVLAELKMRRKIEKTGLHKGEKSLKLAISFQNGVLFMGSIPVSELIPIIE